MDKFRTSFSNVENFSPEDIGIFNKKEVEKFIMEELGVTPIWDKHHFIIGYNENYNVNVNKMLRVTLKDLFGKEEQLKKMQEMFSIQIYLEIVPYISSESSEPSQILSIEKDIIAFLYKSNIEMDLDYYLI